MAVRIEEKKFWCKDANEDPFQLAQEPASFAYALLGYVQMQGSINANNKGEHAASEDVECAAFVWRSPVSSSGSCNSFALVLRTYRQAVTSGLLLG